MAPKDEATRTSRPCKFPWSATAVACARVAHNFHRNPLWVVEHERKMSSSAPDRACNEQRRRSASRSPPIRLQREDLACRRPPFIEPISPPSPRFSFERRASPLRHVAMPDDDTVQQQQLVSSAGDSSSSSGSELDCGGDAGGGTASRSASPVPATALAEAGPQGAQSACSVL